MKNFWQTINEQLDTIEREKIDTYEGIVTIMPTKPSMAGSRAFFAGSGGDRSLFSALYRAGWYIKWAEADYYYTAQHPETGEIITYIEGDIYPGDIVHP